MDKLRDEVISNIRACLISVKGKVPVRQLENDYRTLLGERIPYSKFGCRSTEEFISKIPSLSVNKNSNGEWFVDAKASEKSHHITDMVNKQKPPKKRPPPRNVRFNNYSTAPQTRNWKPANFNYKPIKFAPSQRTAAVSHNQLVSRSPVKSPQFSVKSKLIVAEHSTFRRTNSSLIDNSNTIKASEVHTMNNNSTPVNGLLHTPMRGGHLLHTPQHNRLKTSNCAEKTNDPIDLVSHANSLMQGARQRITRMMSEVSLERDSGNSSPISDTKEYVPTNDIILTDDPIADLKNIVEIYKLGTLDVALKPMKPKKRNAKVLYHCKITVDGQSYLSYPNDFYDAKAAQEYCATKAIEELVPKCTQKKSFLLSDSKDIKERIPPMLQTHFQGIWSWQIEADYADKYMEQLPLNWLEIIDSCDCVAVERIQDRYVLRYCRPGTKGESFVPVPVDISIPSNTVQFGEGNRLFAQITCIMSLNEVWCRQWDTSEFKAYNEMTLLMEPHYNKEGSKEKANNIQLGSYYVANYDSNWYRVRALEIDGNFVNCFLIDYGDEYAIDKDDIYNIKREFAKSQAQAFVCRLAGLEDLYDANVSSESVMQYVGKEVILEAAQSDGDDPDTDQSISVVMYDFASGDSINEQLLELLTIEMATPVIKENTIQEVFVSHLTDDGYVYVQLPSKGFFSLKTLMDYLEGEIEATPPTQCAEYIAKTKWITCKDRLYLSKDDKDGHWYRTKILDMSPKGDMAQIYFVDRGSYEVVKVENKVMYPLDKISDVVHQFPYQTVKVKMALEITPTNFVELAGKLLKIGSTVLLRIVEITEDGLHIGEFYRRSNDEGIFCINKSIMMEIEIKANTGQDNVLRGTRNKLVKLTQLTVDALQKENVPSGGSLASPVLPEIGEYLEVMVPFAVNPWNFFIQPYATKSKLNDMMASLQECYKDPAFSPLQISMILPGQIYATKHSDGIWYRTSVLKVIHSGSISVFYCDFGYYSSLSLDQLVPIDPKFTILPYQALKAKLSGIKPKMNKWSMEDCEYFNKLVKGKAFVSVLRDIEKDELYESDPVLLLTLIDTSTEEDLFVHEELVKKNIAIKSD